MVMVEKDAFKSIILDGKLRVDEGDTIEFVVESTGEMKKGALLKIKGKKEKTEFEILPEMSEHKETWFLITIKEKSIKVL